MKAVLNLCWWSVLYLWMFLYFYIIVMGRYTAHLLGRLDPFDPTGNHCKRPVLAGFFTPGAT